MDMGFIEEGLSSLANGIDITLLAKIATIIVAIPFIFVALRFLRKKARYYLLFLKLLRDKSLRDAVVESQKLIPLTGLWKMNVPGTSLYLEPTKSVSSMGLKTKAALCVSDAGVVCVTIRKSPDSAYRNPTTISVQWDNESRSEETWAAVRRKRYIAYDPPNASEFIRNISRKRKLILVFSPEVRGGAVVVFNTEGFLSSLRALRSEG